MLRRHRLHRIASVLVFALAIGALCSCSQQNPPAGDGALGAKNVAAESSKEPLIVSAAASTKEVMELLTEQFQEQTKLAVKVNPGPSSGLASQILAGAPADLFLSANQQWADEVQKGGQAEAMTRLLTNQLVIVVPQGNPAGIKEPKDLLSAKVKKIALAGEKVPAGMYADQSLTKLDLLKQLTNDGKIVRGQDVRTALAYVERGEAEAGIVYSTDVGMAEHVQSVYEFDPNLHDEIVYVLVLLKHDGPTPAARQLYEFLQSPAADKVYGKFGFTRVH